MPTTEILTAPLVAGSDIGDPSNNAAVIAKETFDFVAQQPGFQQAHFGMQKENPNVITALITWESLQAHKDFIATAAYGTFYKRFSAVIDGKPQIVHADFQPEGSLAKALAAPVTEVAFFIFESSQPSSYEAGLQKFAAAIDAEKSEGYLSSAYGFTVEEAEHEGVKGKAAVLAIGWQSVDAHMKFRETQCFKDHIHLLREGVAKAQMVHVKFLPYVPGE